MSMNILVAQGCSESISATLASVLTSINEKGTKVKWFKHMANASSEGEFIAELESEFGLEGYARYFKLLEAVALRMDETDKCSASYPWEKWQTILKGKRKKLETFLVYLENKRQITLKQNGNILEIEAPKLQELRDEHSRKLRSQSGVTPDKEERRKKEEYTPLPPKGEECGSEKKSEPKQEITFPKSPAGELVGYLREKLVKKGLTDTSLNRKWAEIGVNEANILLKTESADEIRSAIDWFDADERFWGKALNRMSHIRKHWDQYQRGKPDSSKASSKHERLKASELLKYPFIMHVITNEIIPSSEMQYHEDAPNGLYRGVNTYYPAGHLCGIESASVGDTGNGRNGTSATPEPCGA